MKLDRRNFLKTAAGTVTATAAIAAFPELLPGLSTQTLPGERKSEAGSFDFIFFTDTHIEPELNAGHGCEMCFQKIAGIPADFAIMGGDHVFDVLEVNARRAGQLFDLYKKTEQIIKMPLYHTIGNHDAFGVLTKSGVAATDPAYGKKLFEDRMGRTFYSFDHKGYHFVVLDSIQPTEDRLWEARVDEKQLSWLAEDLKRTGPQVPVIVIVHVPLVTAFASYAEKLAERQKYNTMTVANAAQVLAAFEGYNVIAALQGHTHINEIVQYKNTQFITSGAVCGNWWRGPRMGVPEGFTVVSLRNGTIQTRYETYGFKSVTHASGFENFPTILVSA